MIPSVLFVNDDPNILSAFIRSETRVSRRTQKKDSQRNSCKPLFYRVRPRGLEPPRDYLPLGPQPSASANSATTARICSGCNSLIRVQGSGQVTKIKPPKTANRTRRTDQTSPNNFATCSINSSTTVAEQECEVWTPSVSDCSPDADTIADRNLAFSVRIS